LRRRKIRLGLAWKHWMRRVTAKFEDQRVSCE
jgi:hypothetical protein